MTTNHASGHSAEAQAAAYLITQGYRILARNWRTRRCEIDIIAERGGVAYLVEVKSRRTAAYGDGFAYITPQKLRQMQYAAEVWAHDQQWSGDYQLSAMSIVGDDISFMPDLA